jgi:hypothetical protein
MKGLILLLLCSPVLADDRVYQSQTLPGTATVVDPLGNVVNSQSDVYTIHSKSQLGISRLVVIFSCL